MIYILVYSKVMPGTVEGSISDLWEDAWTDRIAAERGFKALQLNSEYYRKELWMKEPGGRRTLIMEERYNGAA